MNIRSLILSALLLLCSLYVCISYYLVTSIFEIHVGFTYIDSCGHFFIATVPLFLQYVCAVFLSCFVPCCAVAVHVACPRLRWLRLCGFGFLLGNTTFLIWFAISMLCYQYWLVCSFGLIHVCSAFVCAKTSRRRTRSSQLSGHWNCCFIQKKISKHF